MLLSVTCNGGLGNRLPPLLSAIRLARRWGRELRVCWPRTTYMPVTCAQLFETRLPECDRHSYGFDSGDSITHDGTVLCTVYNDSVRLGVTSYSWLLTPGEVHRLRFEVGCRGANQLLAYPGLTSEFRAIFEELKPVAAVRRLVDQFQHVDRTMLGVHLRKADLQRWRDGSVRWPTTDKDVRMMMEHYIELNPAQKFYFATDSGPTERRFRKRYGDRLVTMKKTDRPSFFDKSDVLSTYTAGQWAARVIVSERATIEALAEMIILGQTGGIITNGGSSFSQCACILGSTPWLASIR